jgi:flagellar biosynthesis/type III secretory pathway M-ring protein FliF/YscJ
MMTIAGAAGGTLLLVLAAAWMWSRRRKRARRAEVAVQASLAAGGAAEVAGLEARLADDAARRQRLEAEALESLKGHSLSTKKTDVFTKALKENIAKDAAGVALVMRTWLKKGDRP